MRRERPYLVVEAFEKMARAIKIELYQLCFKANSKKEPQDLKFPAMNLSRKDGGISSQLGGHIPRMKDRDKTIPVNLARKMAAR